MENIVTGSKEMDDDAKENYFIQDKYEKWFIHFLFFVFLICSEINSTLLIRNKQSTFYVSCSILIVDFKSMILIGTIMQTKLSFIVKWLIYNFESYGDKGEGVSYIIFTMS